MNLRTKNTVRKRKKKGNGLLIAFVYAVVIGVSLFSIFFYTIFLDSKCERINKNIIFKDKEIYNYQREIKNLKIKLENYSRKEYIVSKINDYRLNLGTPREHQVVTLSNNGVAYGLGRSYAYNF